MGITKRFIYILALGIIPLTFAAITGYSIALFLLYNLISIALLIIDYYISPEASAIEIEATGESLSIYEREEISVVVYNKGDYKLHLRLKDEIPDFHFQTENPLMEGVVPPKEKKAFKYSTMPTKRGIYSFDNIYVKFMGRLRLCTKEYKLKLPREYRVYPNMKNLRKYRLNICNNRMFLEGNKRVRLVSKGTSFESLREYVEGDDYRRVNWKATARGQRPIVNQYEPEKNQHIHILIDTGRPMSYSVKGFSKLDLAINTALVLSDTVNQNGDLSGLLLFNTEVKKMIKPGKGPLHRNAILEALYAVEHTNETSNYEEAFHYLRKKERHRSIVFLFTDFETIEEAEGILRILTMVARNNIIVLLLIKNQSLENIISMDTKNKEDLFNKGVALEAMEERRRIISLLNRRGVYTIECQAEALEYSAINKYINIKNQGYF